MAVTDVLTLAEAKRVLRIASSDEVDDAALIATITAVSELVDTNFGCMVVRTITGEVHDGTPSGPRPLGYRTTLQLRQRPVSTITSVTEYDLTDPVTLTAVTPGVDPADGYVADRSPSGGGLSGILRRWTGSGFTSWGDGGQNIVVTYVAGRYATTADVEDRVKHAAGIILTNMWRAREPGVEQIGEYSVPSSSFPAFAVPNAARQTLPDMWSPPEAFGFA